MKEEKEKKVRVKRKFAPKAGTKDYIDRVTKIVELIVTGHSNAELAKYGRTKWGICPGAVWKIKAAAKLMLQDEAQKLRVGFFNEAVARKRKVIQKGFEVNDMRIVLQSDKELDNLMGISVQKIEQKIEIKSDINLNTLTDEELKMIKELQKKVNVKNTDSDNLDSK